MWILMWMQLLSGLQVEHYQLGSFTKEDQCKIAESRAQVMKQNNVPRTIISDSPALEIYKRCGMDLPSENSEENELIKRRNEVRDNVSNGALKLMDKLSKEYFEDFLS